MARRLPAEDAGRYSHRRVHGLTPLQDVIAACVVPLTAVGALRCAYLLLAEPEAFRELSGPMILQGWQKK